MESAALLSQCPLCPASVPRRYLERHLRQELSYSPWRCEKCSVKFFSFEDSQMHFDAELGRHSRRDVYLTELLDYDLEQRIRALLPAASAASPCPDDPLLRLESTPSPDLHHDWVSPKKLVISASPSKKEPIPKRPRREAVKAEPVPSKERRKEACSGCGELVFSQNRKQHIGRKHLSEPVYACALCPYVVKDWGSFRIKTHMRFRHAEQSGAFRDRKAEFAGRVQQLSQQLFH